MRAGIDKAIERYLGELDRADEVFEQTRCATRSSDGTDLEKAGTSAKRSRALQIN